MTDENNEVAQQSNSQIKTFSSFEYLAIWQLPLLIAAFYFAEKESYILWKSNNDQLFEILSEKRSFIFGLLIALILINLFVNLIQSIKLKKTFTEKNKLGLGFFQLMLILPFIAGIFCLAIPPVEGGIFFWVFLIFPLLLISIAGFLILFIRTYFLSKEYKSIKVLIQSHVAWLLVILVFIFLSNYIGKLNYDPFANLGNKKYLDVIKQRQLGIKQRAINELDNGYSLYLSNNLDEALLRCEKAFEIGSSYIEDDKQIAKEKITACNKLINNFNANLPLAK